MRRFSFRHKTHKTAETINNTNTNTATTIGSGINNNTTTDNTITTFNNTQNEKFENSLQTTSTRITDGKTTCR